MLYLIQLFFIKDAIIILLLLMNIFMKISSKKYGDLIALVMSLNGRKETLETLDLLYEAAKYNKN